MGAYSGLELADLKQIVNSADPNGIRATADGFKSVSSSLDQVITTLQNSQQQLQSSWQGSAADAASQTFQGVIDQATQTKQVSDAMVEHLPQVASQVESAQSKVNSIPEPAKPSGFMADVKGIFGDDDGYSSAKQAAANKAAGVLEETDTQYQQSASYMNSLTGGSSTEDTGFTPANGSTSGNGAFDLGGSNGAMTGYSGYSSGYDGGGSDGYDGSSEDAADPYHTGLTSAHGDGIYGGVSSPPPTVGGGNSRLAGYHGEGNPVTVDPIAGPGPVVGGPGMPVTGPVTGPLGGMPLSHEMTRTQYGPEPLDGPGSRSRTTGGGGEEEESGLGAGNEDGILGSPTSKLTRSAYSSTSSESSLAGEEPPGAGPGGAPSNESGSGSMGMRGMGNQGVVDERGDRAGYLSEEEDYWTGGLPRTAGGDDGIFGGMPMSMAPAGGGNTTIRSAYANGEAEDRPMMGMRGVNGSNSEEERRERPGFLRQERDYWQDPQSANPAVIDH